jgi:hypothetical protein
MTTPPYPHDTRAKGWRFELDHERVRQSDTWALAPREIRPWLLMLWMVAWEQTPCGSLPADDRLIAARLDMPMELFAPHRDVLLRGWWAAEDGRLYHDTLVERVREMMSVRGVDRARADARRNQFEKVRERDGHACVYCGNTKYLTLDHLVPLSRGGSNDEENLVTACRPCNSKKRDRTPEEAGMPLLASAAGRWSAYRKSAGETRTNADEHGETRTNNTGTGTGTGTSTGTDNKNPAANSVGAASPSRGARLAQDWVLPKSWGEWAVDELGMSAEQVRTEAAKFRDYWCAKSGKDATKLDWQATWRNWCRNAKPATKPPPAPVDTMSKMARVRDLLGASFIEVNTHGH